MKLYELALPIKVYEVFDDGSEYCTVHKLDGLYSYCVTEKEGVTHLSANTPLVPYLDGYRIKENDD